METVRYLKEKEVSEVTGFALSTLRNARFNKTGIVYSKIGRAVRYRYDDIISFMDRYRIETQ